MIVHFASICACKVHEPKVVIDGNSLCYFLLQELKQPLDADYELYILSLTYAHK